jgi:hypothetical protein
MTQRLERSEAKGVQAVLRYGNCFSDLIWYFDRVDPAEAATSGSLIS